MAIINMISGPRNMSTAIMYAFAQHPAIEVVDEPFYAYYLDKTGAEHPGKEAVFDSQSSRPFQVFDEIDTLARRHEHIFLKNMGHHMLSIPMQNWLSFKNFFLIRDPEKLIISLSKILKKPTLRDTGMDIQLQLLQYFKEQHASFFVVDSGEVLHQPARYFQIMLKKLGLKYTEKMLSWPAGPKPYDGVWAPYWYKTVHRTTHFEAQPSENLQVPDHCLELYEQCRKIYTIMQAHTI